MTTSNSINFSMNAQEIIEDSLRLIDVLGAGQTVDPGDYSLCLRQLNRLVKRLQARGIHMWTETEAIVFIEKDQASYQLGGTNPDQASQEDIKTELSSALATSDTVVTVDASTGMVAADIIGIVLDSGAMHWDTIASVDSSTQITLTTGVTGAASIDQHVYTYTDSLVKPLDISSVRVQNEAGTETRLRKLSRDEYFKLTSKDNSGQPHSYYFDRQRDHGKLYIYPVPEDAQAKLRCTFQRELHDFDLTTDTQDFPPEWTDPLVWNLGFALCPFFGRGMKAQEIGPMALSMLSDLENWDSEHASLKIR